ncbi:sporulation integral membrane protein YtvI [Paradesulfitobacterium ferrireducens]|uniref:sporulation integral membrane protein YtvI n=1 Tax=Paradesulfitobacterium ferrireducens TaxID=2816476 RepID=UPI001A8F9C45|nr:sporulation integral membrane protein YtvI [Paradesulfitobacterium ferrireducens]
MNHVTKSFLIRTIKFVLFWIVIGLMIYLIGHYIHLFLPFILAFTMTAAINPLKNWFMRKFRMPVGLSVLTAMVVELGGMGAIIALLISRFIREIQDIYIHWPFYSRYISGLLTTWLNKIETMYLKLPPDYVETVRKVVNEFLNSFPNFLTAGISVAVAIPELIIVIVIALVATYFMAKGSTRYISDFVRIFPQEWRESLIELGRDFARAFSGFIKAELIVFLITLACSIIGLILFHAKYAIILGTITGIFGILPVLGVGIILIPWAAIALILGNNILALELVFLTVLISALRHIIEPKILGDNIGLDPLFVLISMYIGLAATGIIGLILGPFILIAYKSLQKAGVFHDL